MQALELWGGVECSVVRVGDVWRDQIYETGHHYRLDDLDRIAALGIKTLRYPVLWERCSGENACGWSWHDERLERLRALGVAPILGLMHHGSGPPGMSLLDEDLPAALAAHAAKVVRRYPWVQRWTPVNEPLTTARFSGLYGHWYPHRCDERSFLRMVAVQCRAILLAMRAIRAGNAGTSSPGAMLVQTEDLGRVFSTHRLAYQAEYENERRWLSLDLLCGRVDRAHPWRQRFIDTGLPISWFDDFLDGEAAPDVIGINHYVTSDRFLDHRTSLYPARLRGSNQRDYYVDTEAVRIALPPASLGWRARLMETWERYGRPLAMTEVHLGCANEGDQVRWLLEAWETALALRREGVNMQGVTAWALFGAMDWNSLLARRDHHYEAGAWDMMSFPPRATLLASVLESLASAGGFAGAVLDQPGWWRREDRLHESARSRRSQAVAARGSVERGYPVAQ